MYKYSPDDLIYMVILRATYNECMMLRMESLRELAKITDWVVE